MFLALHASSKCYFQYILLSEKNGKKTAHHMLQPVYADTGDCARVVKVQHNTANCHYYKKSLCKIKCVEKNKILSCHNNADRAM
jgi:hypothetical protein